MPQERTLQDLRQFLGKNKQIPGDADSRFCGSCSVELTTAGLKHGGAFDDGKALHTCAIKFPEITPTIVSVLMEFVMDPAVNLACDVVNYLREIADQNPTLRNEILDRLLELFPQITVGSLLFVLS